MKLWISLTLRLLSPLIWLAFTITCLIFWTYRKYVDIILKIRIGKLYGGLVDLGDAFAIFTDKSKCVITTMIMFKSDREIDVLEHIKKCFQEKVFDVPEDYPKLSGTMHGFKGYTYWLKNSAKLNECVKTFPVPDNGQYNEDYVKEFAGKINNYPLPQGDRAAWEINVSEKPMITKSEKGDIFRYPVVLRFHHVIGGGLSIFALIVRVLVPTLNKAYGDDIFPKQMSRETSKPDNLKQYLKKLLKQITTTLDVTFYIIFLTFQKRMELIHWREKDKSALHGPQCVGEKIFVWSAEDKVEFVPLVKRIKNKVPNVTFSHVVLTAITGAFANFLKKKDHKVPKIITTFITSALKYPKLDPRKPVPLENVTTGAMLELPIENNTSPIKTLLQVKKNADEITYFEMQSNYLFLKYIFGLFPKNIRGRFHDAGSYTSVISNIPGASFTEMADGCSIEKIIACPPNIGNIGVTLCVLTYDDRFQIGMLVDKSLIASQEEAQEIVDDMFRNFQLLAVESSNMFEDH